MTGEDRDFWWRLDDPDASTLAHGALENYGLPWLDPLSSRDDILKCRCRSESAKGADPVPTLAFAVVPAARSASSRSGFSLSA